MRSALEREIGQSSRRVTRAARVQADQVGAVESLVPRTAGARASRPPPDHGNSARLPCEVPVAEVDHLVEALDQNDDVDLVEPAHHRGEVLWLKAPTADRRAATSP